VVEDVTPARRAMLDVRAEIAKVVVGQDGVVTGLLTALVAGGHVLLEGVPGVAKTLIAKTLATATSLRFARLQFTPDLMPSDVTGQNVLDPRTGGFHFRPGPLFANLVLADEINRTPPRTQAALLEAMEERQVTVGGETRPLPEPFMVVATQNPVEYEGTYPLPEAQLDRFLFKVLVDYPSLEHERAILTAHRDGLDPHDLDSAGVVAVAAAGDVAAARREAAGVGVDDKVLDYAARLVRATRQHPSFELGVSPRGGAALVRAARAWTWLNGRPYVTPDDVKAVARPALRHRVLLRPEVLIEGVRADALLDGVVGTVPAPT
jgi:MoxR-like ATPase